MRQFEMRHDPAVLENRGAGAGAQGQHHLDPFAPDRAEALDVGIVHNPHRLMPLLGQRGLQIEPGPYLGSEMRRCQYPPVAYRAGEADRDPVERAERRGGGLDRGGEHFGRDRRHRGRHADALTDHPTLRIEQGELDPGAADIDGQSARTSHDAPPATNVRRR